MSAVPGPVAPVSIPTALFVPSPAIARFAVGAEGLAAVSQRLGDVPIRYLDTSSQLPQNYRVLDSKRGIIQFGPIEIVDTHLGGLRKEPLTLVALERAFGKRLPEPMHARASWPQDDDQDFLSVIAPLFSALRFMGAELSAAITNDNLKSFGRGKDVSVWLRARFTADTVTLQLALDLPLAGVVEGQFPARALERRLYPGFALSVWLTNPEDRNSLDGWARLEEGLKVLLGRLFTGEHPVTLRTVQPPLPMTQGHEMIELGLRTRRFQGFEPQTNLPEIGLEGANFVGDATLLKIVDDDGNDIDPAFGQAPRVHLTFATE